METMNRIEKQFTLLAARREKGLIAYLTAGDPDLTVTCRLAEVLAEAGADLLELGIPFSDPVADGPVIQKAAARALAGGAKVAQILETVARIRNRTGIPLLFMTYYNPVLQYGLERFAHDAAGAGVDGLIIPDLPCEEAGRLRAAADGGGLALVPLVAPTTPARRLKVIAAVARGFVYGVSVTGVTGPREEIPPGIPKFMERLRQVTSLPVAIGFGIGGPRQAAWMAGFADAVVVGSAIVQTIAQTLPADPAPAVTGLVREIKAALKE